LHQSSCNPKISEETGMAETKKAPAKTVKKAAKKTVAKAAVKKAVAKKAPATKAKKEPTYEEISVLAHRFWVERGRHHGSDAEDWARAEKELKG